MDQLRRLGLMLVKYQKQTRRLKTVTKRHDSLRGTRVPVLHSDSLSSMAFAPDQLLLTLTLSGVVASAYSLWVGIAVAGVMAVVVASYMQILRAYPQGGDYQVVKKNLGHEWGLLAGTSLLVDAVLLIAIVLSASAQFLVALVPGWAGLQPLIATVGVITLAVGAFLAPLKNVRTATRWTPARWVGSMPTYLFLIALIVMVVSGTIQYAFDLLKAAPSAGVDLPTNPAFADGLIGVSGVYLFARAFASGATVLTGVSAISNGVATFPNPRSRNARRSLMALAVAAMVLSLWILWLARVTEMELVDDPTRVLGGNAIAAFDPDAFSPVLAQLAHAVFGGQSFGYYLVVIVTTLVLMMTAVTAFRSFPALVGILAQDGFLPRQMHARADGRRSISGLVVFSSVITIFIVAFNAQPARIIQMYIFGLFLALTLSQLAMIYHWNSALRERQTGIERKDVIRSRALNIIGFLMTAIAMVVVLATKFAYGVWVSVALICVLFVIQRAIRHHYLETAREMALDSSSVPRAMPTRVHAIVIAPAMTKLTELAVATARASAPSSLEILAVAASREDEKRIRTGWEASGITVPLTLLASPKRQIGPTIVRHIEDLRERRPQELVIVYLPHVLVKHWWLSFMHNQIAKSLRRQLLRIPGVAVTSVSWQMDATTDREKRMNDPYRVVEDQ